MNFKQFYLNETTKTEIKNIEKIIHKDGFVCGAEFEFFVYEPHLLKNFIKNLEDTYKNNEINYKWEIKDDYSLKKSFEKSFANEVATPTYTPGVLLEIIKKMSDFIMKYGYTNNTSGIHVSFSHKNIDFENVNLTNLGIRSEEGLVNKLMPSRKNNDFAKSIQDNIFKTGKWEDPSNKYQTLSLRKYDPEEDVDENGEVPDKVPGERLEIRHLGGSGYEYQFKLIRFKFLKTLADFWKSYKEKTLYLQPRLRPENTFDYTIKTKNKMLIMQFLLNEKNAQLILDKIDSLLEVETLFNHADLKKLYDKYEKSLNLLYKKAIKTIMLKIAYDPEETEKVLFSQ